MTIPVLSPDGPTPSFVAVSRDRSVLDRINHEPQLRVVCWVPEWSDKALSFLNNLNPKDILYPPHAKSWRRDDGTPGDNLDFTHHNIESLITSPASHRQYMRQLSELLAPQAGRAEVLRTIADAFTQTASRHFAGKMHTSSTAYKVYPGFDQPHSDAENPDDLLVNFSTHPGSDVIRQTHPVESRAQCDLVVQLPANSFSIWRGDVQHSSPEAPEKPTPRIFLQGMKPIDYGRD